MFETLTNIHIEQFLHTQEISVINMILHHLSRILVGEWKNDLYYLLHSDKIQGLYYEC